MTHRSRLRTFRLAATLAIFAALLGGAARCLADQDNDKNFFTTSTDSHTTTTSSTVDQRQSTGLMQNIVNGGD